MLAVLGQRWGGQQVLSGVAFRKAEDSCCGSRVKVVDGRWSADAATSSFNTLCWSLLFVVGPCTVLVLVAPARGRAVAWLQRLWYQPLQYFDSPTLLIPNLNTDMYVLQVELSSAKAQGRDCPLWRSVNCGL